MLNDGCAGSMDVTANAAMMAAVYGKSIMAKDSDRANRYICWAKGQIRFLLGDVVNAAVVVSHLHRRLAPSTAPQLEKCVVRQAAPLQSPAAAAPAAAGCVVAARQPLAEQFCWVAAAGLPADVHPQRHRAHREPWAEAGAGPRRLVPRPARAVQLHQRAVQPVGEQACWPRVALLLSCRNGVPTAGPPDELQQVSKQPLEAQAHSGAAAQHSSTGGMFVRQGKRTR